MVAGCNILRAYLVILDLELHHHRGFPLQAYAHLQHSNLCPRLRGVNRYETTDMCLISENVKVNVIASYFGERVYSRLANTRALCQNRTNYDIAHRWNGFDLQDPQTCLLFHPQKEVRALKWLYSHSG
ncbi:hypothetical protein F5Y14DRAFT_448632 [Nemania sp. NC0429]|nr:hypothetical protein F5Y14DRAFT_448632 [Nemania sp. NC0429]